MFYDEIIYFDDNNGDSSILKLYNDRSKEYINILFDMGQKSSFIIDEINKCDKKINGIVVTHVDQDHIWGIIKLLQNENFKKNNELKFIIFNAFNESLISYNQGNDLFNEIKKNYSEVLLIPSYLKDYDHINSIINLPIKFFSSVKRDLLRDLKLRNSIVLTFIEPTEDNLKNLMIEWKKNNSKETYKTGEITNESSIVCLIENKDKKILMTGDHTIEPIYNMLVDKNEDWDIKKIDCIKISHHGSEESNTKLCDLAKEFHCYKLFFSSYNKTCSREIIQQLESEQRKVYRRTDDKMNTINI